MGPDGQCVSNDRGGSPVRFPALGRPAPWLAGFVVLCLLAGACGNDEGGEDRKGGNSSKEESGLDTAGDPVRGGRIVYGLEAETSGGWCLPEAQLAPSGN